jgi:hypothetical protein
MFTKFNFEIAGLLPKDPDALPLFAAGLFVSPERTIETDGHQLVIVTAPESQPTLFDQPDGLEEAQFFTPFIMDRESALKIGKQIPKRNPDAPENSMAMLDVHTEAESDSTVAITEDVRRAIFKSLKRDAAKFPNTDGILRDPETARFEIQFNADVIAPVLKLFQEFAGQDKMTPIVTLRFFGPSDGVRIDAVACEQKMTAVVMPMRMVEQSIPVEDLKVTVTVADKGSFDQEPISEFLQGDALEAHQEKVK